MAKLIKYEILKILQILELYRGIDLNIGRK